MGDMDSGNSGSMQSSSTGGGGGDDQEYESRGAESSFPSFFNPPNFQVNPFDNARLLQLYSLNNGSSSSNLFEQHGQQVGFDSLEPGSFMAQTNNDSNSSHMEMVWANKFGSSIRSRPSSDEATCTNTNTTTPGYNNNNNNNNPMNTTQLQHVQLGGHMVSSLGNLQGTNTGSGVPSTENSPRSSNQNQNQNQNTSLGGGGGVSGRNPKKRSRASRRAPTTVLTTDTSNFRQMVQEFTGIPAPPFSAPGFSTRTRLDLFGGMGMGMGMGMSMGLGAGLGMGILPRPGGGGGSSTGLDPPPPSYLLRPFAQKILPTPLVNQQQQQQQNRNTGTNTSATALAADTTVGAALSSSAPAPAPAIASGNTAGNIISSSTSGAANGATFNLSPQNVLQQSPNPMFAFQSLLQPTSSNPPASEKYPLPLIQQDSGMGNLGSKPAGSGSSGAGPRGESEPQSWTGLHQALGLTQVDHDHHHHQLAPHHHNTGSVNEGREVGNFSGTDTRNTQRGAGGATINGTSDNHGGVGRGDQRGMVDSWICSSD